MVACYTTTGIVASFETLAEIGLRVPVAKRAGLKGRVAVPSGLPDNVIEQVRDDQVVAQLEVVPDQCVQMAVKVLSEQTLCFRPVWPEGSGASAVLFAFTSAICAPQARVLARSVHVSVY